MKTPAKGAPNEVMSFTVRVESGTKLRTYWSMGVATGIVALVVAIAAACTTKPECPGSVQSVGSVCGDAGCPTYAQTIATPCFHCGLGSSFGTFSCAGYDVVACGNVDVGALEYFDGTSGALVAIGEPPQEGSSSIVCVGGPASFVVPACTESWNTTIGGSYLCTVAEYFADAGDASSDAEEEGTVSGDAGTR